MMKLREKIVLLNVLDKKKEDLYFVLFLMKEVVIDLWGIFLYD